MEKCVITLLIMVAMALAGYGLLRLVERLIYGSW